MTTETNSSLETVITRVRESDPSYPESISAIPTFPFKQFPELQAAVQARQFTISRFAFAQEPKILELVSPSSASLYNISAVATFLIPLMSLILAFFVSGWFAFGLVYFIVGTRVTTNIWVSSILRAAYQSEHAFCFLFYCSKINCYDLTTRSEYEWQLIKKGS